MSSNLFSLDQLKEIIKANEDLHDKPPPLFVIIHTLKGVMYPQFLPDLMSEFLHQFTLVELFRLKATEKTSLALKMNEALGEEEGYLTDETKAIFNAVIEDQQGMRDLYMKVLTKCIFIVSIHYSIKLPRPMKFLHVCTGSPATLDRLL